MEEGEGVWRREGKRNGGIRGPEKERNIGHVRNISHIRNIVRKPKRMKIYVHVDIINKGMNKE